MYCAPGRAIGRLSEMKMKVMCATQARNTAIMDTFIFQHEPHHGQQVSGFSGVLSLKNAASTENMIFGNSSVLACRKHQVVSLINPLTYPEGPSTQYLRVLVLKTIPLIAFGTIVLTGTGTLWVRICH